MSFLAFYIHTRLPLRLSIAFSCREMKAQNTAKVRPKPCINMPPSGHGRLVHTPKMVVSSPFLLLHYP